MNQNRMRVENHGHNTQEFHITKRVLSHTTIASFDMPLRSNRQLADLESCTKEALVALFQIPGVEKVSLKTYSVNVYLGQAFKWDDVELAVRDILASNFFNGKMYGLVRGRIDEKEKPSPIIIADTWTPARLRHPAPHM
jgi:hypothetical protein